MKLEGSDKRFTFNPQSNKIQISYLLFVTYVLDLVGSDGVTTAIYSTFCYKN